MSCSVKGVRSEEVRVYWWTVGGEPVSGFRNDMGAEEFQNHSRLRHT